MRIADSPRSFIRAAYQRLETATFLYNESAHYQDAFYLAGYAIECSLKAIILEKTTPRSLRRRRLGQITSGSRWHRYDVLLEVLAELSSSPPGALTRALREASWSVSARYATGPGEASEAEEIVLLARETFRWCSPQIQ